LLSNIPLTGNLLQAFSDFKGKLVSYTTMNGETKKGILMPENWNPGEQVQGRVVVPILKAAPIIKSITPNSHIATNNGLSFSEQETTSNLSLPSPVPKAVIYTLINRSWNWWRKTILTRCRIKWWRCYRKTILTRYWKSYNLIN